MTQTLERPSLRAQLRPRRDWYSIRNAATPSETDVYIYDEISWWGVSADQFAKDLRAITTDKINLHLNSPGGSAWDGIAIYNSLRQHKATIDVHVDGIAASAASVIAMAGDSVIMHRGTTMMVHEAWGMTVGNAADHRKTADMLDTLGDEIASIYAAKAGGSVRSWRDVMEAETWYRGQEAVDAGLADETDDSLAAAAENRFDLTIFRHPPADLLGQAKPPGAEPATKRKIEEALRDAGLSSSQAKAMIANGWPLDSRDAEDARLLDTLRTLTIGART